LASFSRANLRARKCHQMGLETSPKAENTTNMHSKTSPKLLEGGVPGPEVGPKNWRCARRKPASTEPHCVRYSPPAFLIPAARGGGREVGRPGKPHKSVIPPGTQAGPVCGKCGSARPWPLGATRSRTLPCGPRMKITGMLTARCAIYSRTEGTYHSVRLDREFVLHFTYCVSHNGPRTYQ
jgi:hypothetical protein